ncbi:MAG: hypothetical protein NTW96_02065 [Planctomycetia bacterium]|nr:hypothetical protein [Planctomycetia bacterium]
MTTRTKTITLRTVDRPKPEPRLAPIPIIVEVFADGFVQVYGPPHVRAVVFNHFADDGGAALHNTIDEYHALELSHLHRPLYDPRRIIGMGNTKPRTIEGEANRQWDLAFLRGLREVGQVLRDRGAAP